ncbi:unnamed protein product [Zymoseptoria tritici ST99CH_3D1]|uniref:ML-like domain-containing protein n=1 Tax=Zymoseptoria tritici ST99CH_1E4 TaxID=1276532 RepID=A0A2H1FJC0_ZYMTR|nr:unnamed protein product [Zymoseptoria tritici ST99CH_1E4]SMR43567.1 unnamed protein product [Zymoseptoria tritici ST99CH_3D1]
MALARLLTVLTIVLFANAVQRQLTTTSFSTCIANSTITASQFDVTIFENRTVSFFLNGTSPMSAHEFVGFQLNVAGEQKWGYTYDPCMDSYPLLASFCPNIPEGEVVRTQSLQLPAKVVLGDLFGAERLDAKFWFVLTNETSLNDVGCEVVFGGEVD